MRSLIYTVFIFLNLYCSAQNAKETEIAKKIIKEAGGFLKEKGEIDNLDKLERKISIIEILENKVIGYNEKGIYRLYPHKSPSFVYILLKDGEKFKILDLKDFSNSLNEIVEYFKTSPFDEGTKVKYLDKILETYKNNDYGAKIRW